MNDNPVQTLADVGLDGVATALAEAGFRYQLSAVRADILGHDGQAGSRQPLPSSAAWLTVDDKACRIPAPEEAARPETGDAPIYRVGGAPYVLPTVRLVDTAPAGESRPTYLGLSNWLLAAFREWRFPFAHRTSGERATFLERFAMAQRLNPTKVATLLAELVRLALLGSRPADAHQANLRLLGLGVPPRMSSWLRRIEGKTPLARTVSRRMVVTATMKTGCPRVTQASGSRIRPAADYDWGLDPVHTPEDKKKIRVTGYLALGVTVKNGQLVPPAGSTIHLGPSTAQIPFARANDPRRLLMGANMQAQAVPLRAPDPPLVRLEHDLPEPPGVNLRVAYLAWKGLNHEDAWVVSESAAHKLAVAETVVVTVPIASVEQAPRVSVEPGQRIHRGEVLLQRTLSPAFLATSMKGLVELWQLEADIRRMELPPDSHLRSRVNGMVERIECWNFVTREGLPGAVEIPDAVLRQYRMVVRFHIRRRPQLELGDKLANRHGHKGIVGRILPDGAMPRWRGQPLEALIDPISVLNRSNWGQVFETILGAVRTGGHGGTVGPHSSRDAILAALQVIGGDDLGRTEVLPPEGEGTGSWQALAGVQFVMRLPKHAVDVIHSRSNRKKKARLGEQGSWASWANGMALRPVLSPCLSPDAQALDHLLATAGIRLKIDTARPVLCVCRSDPSQMNESDPAQMNEPSREQFLQEAHNKRELQRQVAVASGPCWLVLRQKAGETSPVHPVPDVLLPGLRKAKAKIAVALIHVPPLSVRRPTARPDGTQYVHRLTWLLDEAMSLAVAWHGHPAARRKLNLASVEIRLRTIIKKLMQVAYEEAVGWHGSYKSAHIGKRVLRPKRPAARAVISPAGLSGDQVELGLDEVGLPPAIARIVFNDQDIRTDEDLERRHGKDRWVWVKRDPVLHRWGLLWVRARVVPGSTVLLPASVLRALGADFDGDTVMVFRSLPGEEDTELRPPSRVAWDETLGRPVFYPSKQYVYGLHLLQQDDALRNSLNRELQTHDAPTWPAGGPAQRCLEQWATAAARSGTPDGSWWAVVERHALQALARDPGMGLGLGDVNVPLDVVQCGAAKDGPRGDVQSPGGSLAIYARGGDPEQDPIETIMVAAAAATGHFGNLPRHFIYAARTLDVAFVRRVQALCEQAMQRVLSVKGSARPLEYASFKKVVLDPLLKGAAPATVGLKDELLRDLLETTGLFQVCEEIRKNINPKPELWLQWLRRPAQLGELLGPVGAIELPLADPRVRPFLQSKPDPASAADTQSTEPEASAARTGRP